MSRKRKHRPPAPRKPPQVSQSETLQQPTEIAPKPTVEVSPREKAEKRVEIQSFSGPLPPPKALEGYELIMPGAADRIITMAENNNAFMIEMDKESLQGKIMERRRAQNFAFVLGMTGFIVGGILGFNGYQWAASIIGGTTVVGLASIFVLGRLHQPKGQDDKGPS